MSRMIRILKVGGTARLVQGAKSLSKAVSKKIAKTLRDHTNQVLIKHTRGRSKPLCNVSKISLGKHPECFLFELFPGQENDENMEREQKIAGPKFDLLATATLRLEEAGEEVPLFLIFVW